MNLCLNHRQCYPSGEQCPQCVTKVSTPANTSYKVEPQDTKAEETQKVDIEVIKNLLIDYTNKNNWSDKDQAYLLADFASYIKPHYPDLKKAYRPFLAEKTCGHESKLGEFWCRECEDERTGITEPALEDWEKELNNWKFQEYQELDKDRADVLNMYFDQLKPKLVDFIKSIREKDREEVNRDVNRAYELGQYNPVYEVEELGDGGDDEPSVREWDRLSKKYSN